MSFGLSSNWKLFFYQATSSVLFLSLFAYIYCEWMKQNICISRCILSLHWTLNAIVYCAKYTKFMLEVFNQYSNLVNISNWITIDLMITWKEEITKMYYILYHYIKLINWSDCVNIWFGFTVAVKNTLSCQGNVAVWMWWILNYYLKLLKILGRLQNNF